MAKNSTVGVLIPPTLSPAELPGLSSRVEQLGFGELWVSEDYFFLGGPTSAAISLAATSDITVGIGIMSAVVRHPAVVAMEVSTLVGCFGDRLITGIGHGVPAWTRQMGLYPRSPVTSLRTAIETTQQLLAGQTLTIDEGPFRFDEVSLAHPAAGMTPIYAGVIGPKSLQMSGAYADGTIMSVVAAPEYLRYATKQIAAGAATTGRDPGAHRIPTFAIYHVSADEAVAREQAREALAFYLQAMGPTPMTGVYGFNEALKEILALGDLDEIAAALPDEWLDIFTVAGTPQTCAEKIAELLDAGATSVVLAPYPAESTESQIVMTSAEVLPLLDGRPTETHSDLPQTTA